MPSWISSFRSSFRHTRPARTHYLFYREDRAELRLDLSDMEGPQHAVAVAAETLRLSSENFRAAESRIVDADVAEESAGLVKNRTLQQAGAAVLAQADQLPAPALPPLRPNCPDAPFRCRARRPAGPLRIVPLLGCWSGSRGPGARAIS